MKDRKIYPWIVVGLLWFVALLNYMDRQMLSTMKDAMQIDIIELQSATNFGRLMAVFLWIYGLMSPMAGIIADRVSRKWLIVGSLFVWSAVTYGMGYADTFNHSDPAPPAPRRWRGWPPGDPPQNPQWSRRAHGPRRR